MTSKPDFSSTALTVEEVAALLRVNRKTIYDAVKLGTLPGAVRIGGVIRIHGPTVLKWMETGSAPPSRGRARNSGRKP